MVSTGRWGRAPAAPVFVIPPRAEPPAVFGLPSPGHYTGQPLRALVGLWLSENVSERAIGIAAVNAHWNSHDPQGGPRKALDLVEDRGSSRTGGSRTVVIGRFPDRAARLPGAAVVEREPGPDDYPEEVAPGLLAQAEFVAITASKTANASLPGLLAMIKSAKTVLVGPGVPLAPPLFAFRLHALSGFAATDLDGVVRTVQEGGGVKAMRPFRDA